MEGLKNLSTWSAHLRELHSWKLSQTQPCPLRRVNVRQVPSSPGKDQSLRQQFTHQSSMQAAEPEASHWSPAQQESIHTRDAGPQLPHIGAPEGYLQGIPQVTAQPQLGTSLQQLSPSQRRAQSSALFAAVAAATQMQPKAVLGTGMLLLALIDLSTQICVSICHVNFVQC